MARQLNLFSPCDKAFFAPVPRPFWELPSPPATAIFYGFPQP